MAKVYVIKVYVNLIKRGHKNIEDVPEEIRDEVQKELDKQNNQNYE